MQDYSQENESNAQRRPQTELIFTQEAAGDKVEEELKPVGGGHGHGQVRLGQGHHEGHRAHLIGQQRADVFPIGQGREQLDKETLRRKLKSQI